MHDHVATTPVVRLDARRCDGDEQERMLELQQVRHHHQPVEVIFY